MLDRTGVYDTILREGWLSRTPSSFQNRVLERSHVRQIGRGVTIYSIGDPPGGMYGLVSGGFSISIAPRERGPYIANIARPGTWFGEAAAITGEPRRVTLATTRYTVLLHLPLHAIQDIVGMEPAAWRFIALASVHHLDSSLGGYDDLLIRDPVKRCIAVLLRLAGCRLPLPTGLSPIDIDLSQTQIADLANVARTTLNATLSDLEKSGKLERAYRCIRLLAPDAMRAGLID